MTSIPFVTPTCPKCDSTGPAHAVGCPDRVDYLSLGDTSKLLRKALKDAFPDGRFRVRSSSYSGGSSIDIRYMDGPDVSAVDAVVDVFAGKGFDGMIDLAYYIDAVVDRDGRIVGTTSSGTVGSHGTVPAWKTPVPAGGRTVHFGVSYVFVTRFLSKATKAKVDDALARVAYDRSDWSLDNHLRKRALADLGPLAFGDPKAYD